MNRIEDADDLINLMRHSLSYKNKILKYDGFIF